MKWWHHLLLMSLIAGIALFYRLDLFLPENYWTNYGDLGDAYLGYACQITTHNHIPLFLGDWVMWFGGYLVEPCELTVSVAVSLFQVLPIIPLWLFLKRETNRYIAYACVILYLINPYTAQFASAAAFKLFVGITVFGWIFYRLSGKHRRIEAWVYPFLALASHIYIWFLLGLWQIVKLLRTRGRIPLSSIAPFAFSAIPLLGYTVIFKPSLFTMISNHVLVLKWSYIGKWIGSLLTFDIIMRVMVYGAITRLRETELFVMAGFLFLPWYEPGRSYVYANRFTSLILFVSTIMLGLLIYVVWTAAKAEYRKLRTIKG